MPRKSQTRKKLRQTGTSKADEPMYTSKVPRTNPAHTDLCCDLIVNMATYLSTNPITWGGQSLKVAELLRYVGHATDHKGRLLIKLVLLCFI